MASGTFDPSDIPLSRPPLTTMVVRYDPQAQGGDRFRPLPNVLLTGIGQREGADSGTARFRYATNDAIPDLPFPTQFEDLYPLEAASRWKVNQDDRLLVLAWDETGRHLILFDGFAQVPEVAIDRDTQLVSFVANGVACRLWDRPAEGALYRDASDPDAGAVTVTGLPVRFNPNDKDNVSLPNATPKGKDVESDFGDHAAFLEPNLKRDPDPRRFWTLPMAVTYLLVRNVVNGPYVTKAYVEGDDLLQSIAPGFVGATIDLRNPASFKATDIVLRDYDAGNKPAIEAVAELLEYSGFAMRFAIETKSGLPQTSIRVYRKDGLYSPAPLDLFLGEPGPIDPAAFNVGTLHLARDTRAVANEFTIETAPTRVQASFVLAPLFRPQAGDEADAARKAFVSGNFTPDTSAATREKYRLYGFDECGDGHWDSLRRSWAVAKPGDLGPVLNVGADGKPLPADQRAFAHRYRPALTNLLQKDQAGGVVAAQLFVSRNCKAIGPVVFTPGDGDWQPVTSGWKLDPDQLGIIVTDTDPEAWGVGDYKGEKRQVAGKDLRGVTGQAKPSTDPGSLLSTGAFKLRLTCVIEADAGIDAKAGRTAASPTQFAVGRRIDARDHFLLERFDFSAVGNSTTAPARDDTEKATAYAESFRSARETAPSTGSVTIPRFTDAYSIGSRIRSIAGRDCSLRSNAGSQAGQRPQYPSVVAIDWSFEGGQSTTLTLSDRRHDPQRQ